MNNCPYPRLNPPGRNNVPYPVMNVGDPPRGPQRILQRGNPLPLQEGQPLPTIHEEANIPPLPNANVNVIKLTKTREGAEKMSEEMEVNGAKRTRGKEKEDETMEGGVETSGERKKKSKEEKVRRRRRRINLHDFSMGHGMTPYDVIKDMQGKGLDITWPQFLALCPQIRREMARSISTRTKPSMRKTSTVKIAPIEAEEDIVPILDCYIKGRLVKNGLVDGGAQICIMTKNVMHKLGLRIQEVPEIKVKMAGNSKAKCLGLIKNVKVETLGIKREVDFYVMSAKGNGYPLILGRPWLMKVGALQDWEIGKLICRHEDRRKVVYNMKEQKQEEIHDESTASQTEEDSFEDTSDEEVGSTTTEEESSIEVMGVRFRPQQQKCVSGLEEVREQGMPNTEKEDMVNHMLSSTLTFEEKKEYKNMLLGFPHLFVKDYVDVRGVSAIQHHIILKPEVIP